MLLLSCDISFAAFGYSVEEDERSSSDELPNTQELDQLTTMEEEERKATSWVKPRSDFEEEAQITREASRLALVAGKSLGRFLSLSAKEGPSTVEKSFLEVWLMPVIVSLFSNLVKRVAIDD